MQGDSKYQNTQGIRKLPDIWEAAVDVGDFIEMDLPRRPTILDPWLRGSSLVMVYAERGVGKTWFGLSLALCITTGGSIGSWDTTNPTGVLYIDGEVAADEMQERIKELSATLPAPVATLKLLSSDLLHQNSYPSVNITQQRWRRAIIETLTANRQIGVLILDNLSCLTPGIEENDKESWDVLNQYILELRFMGIAVIFLHHSGKSGKQRGTSGREDALDIVIKLSKPPGHNPPDGAKFIVSFEKSRGVYGSGISNFTFSIGKDKDGGTVWLTDAVATSHNKGRIIALLGGGNTPKVIVDQLGVTKQLVSKHKIWAIEEGYLHDEGGPGRCSFTEKGREKYANYLDDN